MLSEGVRHLLLASFRGERGRSDLGFDRRRGLGGVGFRLSRPVEVLAGLRGGGQGSATACSSQGGGGSVFGSSCS